LVLINLIRGQAGSSRERLRDGVVIIAASVLAFYIFVAGGIPAPAWDPGTVVGLGVIVLIMLGAPVAFCIAFCAILGFWVSGATPLVAVPHQMMNGVDSFILLAVPFFLLAGQFMNEGGITERLVALASNLVAHRGPGPCEHPSEFSHRRPVRVGSRGCRGTDEGPGPGDGEAGV
jgi:hypothetical protein